MEPQFKKLMQIGIIVRNIDESVKFYEEMGLYPWDITCINNTCPPFEDLTFDGEPLNEKGDIIKTAMLQKYGLEIELIEPVAKDTAYMKWLENHGPGIHHVAFDIKDHYEDFLSHCKQTTGKEPWIRGQGIGGKMDFSYVDLREELGLIVECYKQLQPDKPGLDYNHSK